MGRFFHWLWDQLFGHPAPLPLPAFDVYGFQWVPGGPAPAALQGYNFAGPAPGLYVAFMPQDLAVPDEFGDGVNVAPIFNVPAAPSPALQALIARYQANPPPTQQVEFTGVTPQRIREVQGFFDYVSGCLAAINQALPGQLLLAGLAGAAARYPVFIVPSAYGGNQINGVASGQCQIVGFMSQLATLNRVATAAMVDARYAAIPLHDDRYRQFATDLNQMPLYSLFEDAAAYPPTFLQNHLQYHGAPVDFQVLRDWLTVGLPAFDNFLDTDATVVQGVTLVKYFRLAVIALLRANSPAGAGCNSIVQLNPRIDHADPQDLNAARPPAIGLAHELVHALHNALGDQPGDQFGHFTTTLTELLAVGLGPFAGVPISENAVRAAWPTLGAAALGALDNRAAGQRTIYELPVLPDTPVTMRGHIFFGGAI